MWQDGRKAFNATYQGPLDKRAAGLQGGVPGLAGMLRRLSSFVEGGKGFV